MIRRLFPLLSLVLILVAGAPWGAAAGPGVVIEATTGRVLYEEDAGVPWYPASLTKLMTAYTVFREIKAGRISLDSRLRVSRYASMTAPSKIGLPADARISVGKALAALLVRSANDMATVLAEGVAGNEAAFVRLMNRHARALGMSGSYFVNPHGLPDVRQVTTARDLAVLARAILSEFPEHADLFAQRTVKIGRRRFRNRNGLLKTLDGADGMKTGFICDSGYNIVVSATREGRRIIAVVLGEKSGGARNARASELIDTGFASEPRSAETSLAAETLEPAVADIANLAPFRERAKDMKASVCRRLGKVRITKWWRLQKRGVVLHRSASALEAGKAMRRHLLALRDVIFAGKGAVYKEEGEGQYVAALSSLDASQVERVCGWFEQKGRPCEKLEPVPHDVVVAKLKAEAEARAKRRAARRARLEAKRKARAKRRAAARKKKKEAEKRARRRNAAQTR